MENIVLENSFLSVRINFKGAELSGLYNKLTDVEHIWQADPQVWARHAPVLFPIVGRLKNGKYFHKGSEYNMPQHGFARDMDFVLDEITETKAVFKLESNEDTFKYYPFNFSLCIAYKIEGRRLDINYRVVNNGDEEMFFQIGAHPGFTVPFDPSLNFEDYYLEFSEKENVNRLLLSDNGLLGDEIIENYLSGDNIIALGHSVFSKDALILEGLSSEQISIKSEKSDMVLSVGVKDFPYLGIWTKPGAEAPFICIEPWHGITDTQYSNGILKDKKAVRVLGEQESFEMNFYIEIS